MPLAVNVVDSPRLVKQDIRAFDDVAFGGNVGRVGHVDDLDAVIY